MTYDHILEVARQHTPTAPPFQRVWDARLRPVSLASEPRTQLLRHAILGSAGILALWSIVTFGREAWSVSDTEPTRFLGAIAALLLLLVGFLGPVALGLGLRRSQGLVRQVLLRAACWSMLELCVMATFLGAGPLPMVAALFFGAILLLMGSDGLEHLHGTFQPVAYRGLLLGTLVLAFADAQTLVVLTGLHLAMDFPASLVLVPALGAVAMITAVVGLARLRGWALIFNVVVNLVVAGLALGGFVTPVRPFAFGLVGTALVQLALVAPLLRVALGRSAAPVAAASTRFTWAKVTVVAMMLAAVGATIASMVTGAPLA